MPERVASVNGFAKRNSREGGRVARLILWATNACLPPTEDLLQYSYESFLKELGGRLRQMRTARGWTLRHMIVAHGFHLAHWQGFEKGKGISVPSLLRVCEVFDISAEDLIAGLGVVEQAGAKPASSAVGRDSVELQPDPISSSSSSPDGPEPRSPRRKRS